MDGEKPLRKRGRDSWILGVASPFPEPFPERRERAGVIAMSAKSCEEKLYFTPRHLLEILKHLDEGLLDMPLVLVHGRGLDKPNLVHGFVPAAVSVNRAVVESKAPSLLMIGQLTD